MECSEEDENVFEYVTQYLYTTEALACVAGRPTPILVQTIQSRVTAAINCWRSFFLLFSSFMEYSLK
jgi:hypothetical protein